MEYRYRSVWDVVKRFLIGWAAAFGVLLIVSFIKYHDFIFTALGNNMWAGIHGIMPLLLILGGILYLLRLLCTRASK